MIEHVLRASLEQHKIITIIYLKKDIITKRNIKVLSMDDDIIKAYCYLRGQVRVFQRQNILAAAFCRARV